MGQLTPGNHLQHAVVDYLWGSSDRRVSTSLCSVLETSMKCLENKRLFPGGRGDIDKK